MDQDLSKPHRSVLLDEVLEMLPLAPGGTAVDVTVGAGGHAMAMVERIAPRGRLVCFDVDPEALRLAAGRLAEVCQRAEVELDLICSNYSDIESQLAQRSLGGEVQGIVADLGVSSMQLDRPERGFSFRHDAPLDMRMDPDLPQSGADLLRVLPEGEMADLFFRLGGERGSRRIARRIAAERERGAPVETTGQLEKLVRSALRVQGHRRIHPATRTFQALRMAVNRELERLETFLDAAPRVLAMNGVLAVISFHSGEDRLVKQRFKASVATGRFQLMRKSVVRPGHEESGENPRSRSAKLRGLKRGEPQPDPYVKR